eukprot:CAMPEP_0167777810 /NCGR_PEP_ID=MMETSP0111_2-20121227/3912_1 /TAXON_ID=91324 /ORGANISM="Lotharella globosa, Strain CCCM811" /LENGTH=76 /DNA_ID=CAMNT_0007668059 /DNA_START=391 /DNA_END=621 /DNA_ORIENTATION=+
MDDQLVWVISMEFGILGLRDGRLNLRRKFRRFVDSQPLVDGARRTPRAVGGTMDVMKACRVDDDNALIGFLSVLNK